MDAKYNWLIDNGAVRLTLTAVAFAPALSSWDLVAGASTVRCYLL